MSLANKATAGIVWNFVEQLARRGITVAVTLLLAYFLTPEDFGLVAMMAVFLALGASLMDSGFKQALIRLKDATQVDFNTGFYANITLGLLAYALLFLSAPWIASFYQESKLVDLVRVASLAIIINAFQVIQVTILSRDLNFKAQLKEAQDSIAEYKANEIDVDELTQKITQQVAEEYEVKLYREQKLREVGNEIIPELVMGSTKEEIDNSIIASQERYKTILQNVAKKSTPSIPSVNVSTGSMQSKEINPTDIANMSPSEWAEYRKTLGLR